MVEQSQEEELPQPQPQKVFLTRQQAALYLGCSLRTIDRYAFQGKLTRYSKRNLHIRYDREEVKALAAILPEPRRQQ